MAAFPALLLVHGFPLDGRMWRSQVEALSHMRRVLTPDLPGHGIDSSDPESSMDAMAESLARFLDREGIKQVDLGGFSMGGYVCFAFLRLFPGRVRSLALVDTRSGADTETGRAGRDAMMAAVRDRGAVAPAESMLPGMFTAEVDALVLAETGGWMVETSREALVADLAAMRDRVDSTPDLPGITVPTLVVVGDQDPITPVAESEAMAAAIPGARLVVVPGAAHLSPVQRPDAVSAALRQHLEAVATVTT
ncbi:MAG: alpha/beta fold hydrolase [Candidatus Dormibacteria bacterium]